MQVTNIREFARPQDRVAVPIHILMLEDSLAAAAMVRAHIDRADMAMYELDQVATLQNGIDLLKQRRYDVIILDLGLPDSTGLETYLRIREWAKNQPVVILTAQADQDIALAALKAGAQDYLVKGTFNSAAIGRLIRYAIERKRVMEDLRTSAYHAGMAEISASVLHNIGNAVGSILERAQTLRQEVSDLGEEIRIMEKTANMAAACRAEGDIAARDQAVDILIQVSREAATVLRDLREGTLGARADQIHQGVEHVAEILKLHQGMATPKATAAILDIEQTIEDTLALCNIQIGKEGIEIVVDVDDDLGELPLPLPRNQLMQMLLNLLKNSQEAIRDRNARVPGRGRISLRAQRNGTDGLMLKISDNGCGVTHEQQKHLFHFGYTTKVGGSGFGLHSAANFVQSIGGHIEVESAGADKGATFLARLPVVRFSSNAAKQNADGG